MQFDIMRGLIKPVETVQNFLSRLTERTGMFGSLDGNDSIHMAQAQLQEWLNEGHVALKSVSQNKNTTTYVVLNEVEHHGGKSGPRLVRDTDAVKRCTVPVGQHGHFEVSEPAAAAINHLRNVQFRPCQLILDCANVAIQKGYLNASSHPTECLAVKEFDNYGVGGYYQPYFCDSAWRLYAWTLGIASHQGGDFHRAVCWFAQSFDCTREDIDFMEMRVKEEYGVGYHNYTLILHAGTNGTLIDSPEKYGIKEKKKWRALAAAYALHEALTTGKTSYILQLDHTCSGFQFWGMLTGCTNALTLTNVMPERDGSVNDLYTAVYDIAAGLGVHPLVRPHEDHFYNRPTGKELTVPIGYGASANTAAGSLLLAKGKTDMVKYLDGAGRYIPGSLEASDASLLNKRNLAIWQGMGFKSAVDASQDLSTKYTESIFTLSKPLQIGMQIVKESVKRANKLDSGNGIFEFTNVMGCTYRCAKVVPDFSALEEEGRPRMVTTKRFTLPNGKRSGGWKMMPNIIERSEAAAPPRVIHTIDSGCIMYVALCLAKDGIPYAPIHDSHGIPAPMWRKLMGHVGEYFFEKMDVNVLLDYKKQYNIQGHGDLFPYDQSKGGDSSRLCGMTL